MNYQDMLRPWAIFRCQLSGNICVARFRTRGDAYAYLSILRANNPGGAYEVVFDHEPAKIQA
jgi:hypothetical protein